MSNNAFGQIEEAAPRMGAWIETGKLKQQQARCEMAKDKSGYEQADMFPVTPEIAGLGITEFKIKGGSVAATVEGATNTNDIALLDSPCWQKAVAAWLLNLCGGDVDVAEMEVKKAYIDHINRNAEAHRPTPEHPDYMKDAAGEVIPAEQPGTAIVPIHGNKRGGKGNGARPN